MSDTQLRQQILDVFQWDPRVETAKIRVSVKRGVVSLSGLVGTDDERVAAEEDACHVVGVHQLRERIHVKDALAAQSWRGTMDFAAPTD
jgi:hyperosmotically inducible protein